MTPTWAVQAILYGFAFPMAKLRPDSCTLRQGSFRLANNDNTKTPIHTWAYQVPFKPAKYLSFAFSTLCQYRVWPVKAPKKLEPSWLIPSRRNFLVLEGPVIRWSQIECVDKIGLWGYLESYLGMWERAVNFRWKVPLSYTVLLCISIPGWAKISERWVGRIRLPSR